jgi:hypothetical protein
MSEGKNTSEFKLAKISVIASIVLPVLAALIEAIQNAGFVENPLALSIVGVVGSLLASLGYTASRAVVKKDMIKLKALGTAVEKKS